jgi:hypothetical protein
VATGKSPYTILKEYEQTIIDSLINSLESNKKVASGNLSQSIEAKTKIFGQSISLEVYMDDYWKFIDRGVNGTVNKVGSEYSFKSTGKRIPKDAMLKFIRDRGIVPKGTSNLKKLKGKGKLSQKIKKAAKEDNASRLNSLSFVLGNVIKKKGIKPTNFVEEGISGIERQLEADLLEAVGRQIEVQLTVK